MIARQAVNWFNRNAGGIHRDQQEADALLFAS
jgi:hypothetical protein